MDTPISRVEACAATGVSYRKAHFWESTGALVPAYPAKGSGSRASYLPHQLKHLVALDRISEVLFTPNSKQRMHVTELSAELGKLVIADPDADAWTIDCGFGVEITVQNSELPT